MVTSAGKQEREYRVQRMGVFFPFVREHSSNKVMKQRSEENEGMSHGDFCGENTPGSRKSKCKGPVASQVVPVRIGFSSEMGSLWRVLDRRLTRPDL